MELNALDVSIMVVFMASVITIGILKSRKEKSSEDYFLAGRGLKWWLIGFSLIAANISAEQFVGMSGQAAKSSIGLAIASYEWIAAITLVVVAVFFLPKFLKSGIFTIPEYLEYRYNHTSRLVMSLLMVVIYAGVTIPTVIFLGAKVLVPMFSSELMGIPINIKTLSWFIGILAGVYVAAGGLKACAWADLIQGSALIVGGAIIMVLSFMALDDPSKYNIDAEMVNSSLGLADGATFGQKFASLKESSMHMVLPSTSSFLPWTALLIGIWVPNFYYWGLNQFIMQRTLGAHSLREGQRGVVFAASLKLVIPFIVCIPGIIAFTLYSPKMQEAARTDILLNQPVLQAFQEAKATPTDAKFVIPFDSDFAKVEPDLAGQIVAFNASVLGKEIPSGSDLSKINPELLRDVSESYVVQQELIGYDYEGAFPLLIRYLTPHGLRGFILAALMGAVISSLAAMLNAASTIFTMDIYNEWFNKNASQSLQVWIGRCCIPVGVLIGCIIAPFLADPKFSGAFAYIQEFQGFVSPGILTVFLFGLFVKKTPRFCGVLGLVLSPIIYGMLFIGWGEMAFLNRMAITVGLISLVLAVMTISDPLKEVLKMPEQAKIEMVWSKGSIYLGIFVIIMTIALYIIFW